MMLFVIMMAHPVRLTAQDSATGAIRGTVIDASGSRVALASIVIVNTATATRFTAVSDAEGRFAFDLLPPGDYSVRAIATVVETWGSAPRPTGSNLVIDEDGNFLGSVSGGCVEGAVVTEALDVIQDGKPKMLEFGVADETAWRVGLSCGGTIRVYVEKLD